MGLHEEAVDLTRRHRGAREQRDEGAVPAGPVAEGAGLKLLADARQTSLAESFEVRRSVRCSAASHKASSLKLTRATPHVPSLHTGARRCGSTLSLVACAACSLQLAAYSLSPAASRSSLVARRL